MVGGRARARVRFLSGVVRSCLSAPLEELEKKGARDPMHFQIRLISENGVDGILVVGDASVSY